MSAIGKTIAFIILLIAFSSIISACRNKLLEKEKAFNPDPYKEILIKTNKQMTKNESDLIDDFVRRYGWTMEQTGTGLRYMIYKKGYGLPPKKGDYVIISYSSVLLNGDSCYSSGKDGYKEFQIGSGVVESGLDEGILLLRIGDKAKFIIPSHLAFGLLGDQNKIPPKATLVYDVELIEIRNIKIKYN
jgi:FKBP-type peptidyl-prolyl cis-trans isomerase